MGVVGLSGAPSSRLSSFACAVPGIMATRSIPDWRDRLVTILIAPLMTCSARLPVYALLIAAFIPSARWRPVQPAGPGAVCSVPGGHPERHGWWPRWAGWRGAVRRGAAADGAAQLPLAQPAQPGARPVGARRHLLRRVGGIILAVTVLLWFLSTYPAPPEGATERPSNTAWPAAWAPCWK